MNKTMTLEEAYAVYDTICNLTHQVEEQIAELWTHGQEPVVRPAEMPAYVMPDQEPSVPFINLQVGLWMIRQKYEQYKQQVNMRDCLRKSDVQCTSEIRSLDSNIRMWDSLDEEIGKLGEEDNSVIGTAMLPYAGDLVKVLMTDTYIEACKELEAHFVRNTPEHPHYFTVGKLNCYVVSSESDYFKIRITDIMDSNTYLTPNLLVRERQGQIRAVGRKHLQLRKGGNK
jgi:hypothetical protein